MGIHHGPCHLVGHGPAATPDQDAGPRYGGLVSLCHFQVLGGDPEPVERALEDLEEVIMFEGPHTIAAFLLEPVVGANGVLIPPDGYMQGVRRICDKYGILLIADEVMTGFGRTGKWFAVEHWGVVPDMITMAKGLASSYMPLSATVTRRTNSSSSSSSSSALPSASGSGYSSSGSSSTRPPACKVQVRLDFWVGQQAASSGPA